MERSGVGWQRYLLNRVGVDWRLKENNRFRDQTQKAMAASPSRQGPSGGNALEVYRRAQDPGSQRRGTPSQQGARGRGFCKASARSGVLCWAELTGTVGRQI